MRNRWAMGIEPRHFRWVLKNQLAICERPGGCSRTHRRVRRQEEVVWIKQAGFTRVVSTLPTEHNIHAYEELKMSCSHFPVGSNADSQITLQLLFNSLNKWIADGEKIILHREGIDSELMGLLAGFLSHTGRLPHPSKAISAIEHLFGKSIDSSGRLFVLQPDYA